MRVAIALLLFVFQAAPFNPRFVETPRMATVAQAFGDFNGSGSATNLIFNSTGAISAGSSLIAFINVYNGTVEVDNITDNRGNTWSRVNSVRSSADSAWSYYAYKALNAGAGSTTFDIELDGGAYVGAGIIELTDAGDVIQNTPFDTTISGAVLTGSAINAAANGRHLAAAGYAESGATCSPGTGWNETLFVDETNSAGAVLMIDRAAVISVSQTAIWNINRNVNAIGIHLVVEDGGGPPPLVVIPDFMYDNIVKSLVKAVAY